MSPGATFERVYNELKRMLAEGELPPGTPLEPTLLGEQLASSITPIRDALHRLTGERLVEAPNHNGFRVPLLTEAALRDLYDWNGQLLILAARAMRPASGKSPGESASAAQINISVPDLFVAIARTSGNAEHARAVEQLNDRLAPIRKIEPQLLDDISEEQALLQGFLSKLDRSALAAALDRYHRRRVRAVSGLIAALMASASLSR
ncbi:GntR family transcriptional regulator [Sphingomonas sp. HF-S3]|uniref:GntR family transcriptional regulator n=1 Tax=Sphingomonas rustica TaxID=3103142 RepID=A0ABV0B4W9_9SPHN